MASKHVPLRRCVVCREQRPQQELIRFVRDDDGQWQLDVGRKAGGRGAWLCRDSSACYQPKKLARFFRGQAERIHDVLTQFQRETQGADITANDVAAKGDTPHKGQSSHG